MEDKLFKDEYIRLEALTQAVIHHNRDITVQLSSNIIHTAKDFEKYIRGDKK